MTLFLSVPSPLKSNCGCRGFGLSVNFGPVVCADPIAADAVQCCSYCLQHPLQLSDLFQIVKCVCVFLDQTLKALVYLTSEPMKSHLRE